MENINISLVFSLAAGIVSLVALVYVFAKQAIEVTMPTDWLTRLRWIIFAMLLAAILGVVPVLGYNLSRLLGYESETFRNVATITGNVSRVATAGLLVMVYRYRRTAPEPKPPQPQSIPDKL